MKTSRRLLAACATLLAASVGLLLLLNLAKIESTLEKRARDRQMIVVNDIAKSLEAHLALGLVIDDTAALRSVLTRALDNDTQIKALAVLDSKGKISLSAGNGTPHLWIAARPNTDRNAHIGSASENDTSAIAVPLRNAFNLASGWVVLEYSLQPAQTQSRQALADLWPTSVTAMAAALVLLGGLGTLIARRHTEQPAQLNRQLSLLVTALLLLVQGAIAWSTYQTFTRIASQNAPLLASTLAQTITPGLQRALDKQIPLQELRGVEEWLKPLLEAGKEFHAIHIRESAGQTLYSANATTESAPDTDLAKYSFPLSQAGQPVGTLDIELDLRALAERSRQLTIEFATLLVSAALLVHELLKVINRLPVAEGQQDMSRLRPPLFLFFMASELPRSFLPIWSNELAFHLLPASWEGGLLHHWLSPLNSMPETVLATVPISVFLLAVALSSPFAGRLCSQHGAKSLLKLGLLLALSGHALALFTQSWLVLCLARLVAGVSFGFVSIAAFDCIGRQGGGRASGMALYLTAYVSGGICGAGLGALVADRADIPAVFGMGLMCVTLAGMALQGVPSLEAAPFKSKPMLGTLLQVVHQSAFMRLVIVVALPMQIVQQGLLFYWAPLALAALGERPSFVGLAMMGYFLMVLFLNGPSARFADHSKRHHAIIVGALLLAALASVLSGIFYAPFAIAGAIVLIGVAWASGFPSLGAVSLRMSQTELTDTDPAIAIGVYRTVERIGAMLAPMLVALLVVGFGYIDAAKIMGAVLAVCALTHLWISKGRKQHE